MEGRTLSNGNSDPIPVNTGNGFTVSYRGRFLYSRRYPAKNPEMIAKELALLPGTLILLVSPVLDYGIQILLDKLPENSFILGIEHEKKLFDFSGKNKKIDRPQFKSLYVNSPEETVRFIDEHIMSKIYSFRRCVRIDFSAGGMLHPEFYKQTENLLSEYISTFWKNRITLIKLGRNYAKNIFRNCGKLHKNVLSFDCEKIKKPVIVAGAGPSLDTFMPFIKKNRSSVFLIAVDAALSSFRNENINPDLAVTVESQIWIDSAFCGLKGKTPVLADLSSRPGSRGKTETLYFFLTPYTKASFLNRVRSFGLADFDVPPLGSVGLSALFVAGKIREAGKCQFPVFFTGLDFSWGKGFSHSKGSFQTTNVFSGSNRFSTQEQKRGELLYSALKRKNPDLYTTATLAGYAEQCAAHFSGGGFFRLGNAGLPVDFPSITMEEAEERIKYFHANLSTNFRAETNGETENTGETAFSVKTKEEAAVVFLETEEKKLQELKAILTGEKKENKEKLSALIKEADYLYIHFPDFTGEPSMRPDFLNRIRVETDFFLKTIRIAIKEAKGLR